MFELPSKEEEHVADDSSAHPRQAAPRAKHIFSTQLLIFKSFWET